MTLRDTSRAAPSVPAFPRLNRTTEMSWLSRRGRAMSSLARLAEGIRLLDELLVEDLLEPDPERTDCGPASKAVFSWCATRCASPSWRS
jgi:hypothetical protein